MRCEVEMKSPKKYFSFFFLYKKKKESMMMRRGVDVYAVQLSMMTKFHSNRSLLCSDTHCFLSTAMASFVQTYTYVCIYIIPNYSFSLNVGPQIPCGMATVQIESRTELKTLSTIERCFSYFFYRQMRPACGLISFEIFIDLVKC